MLSWKMGSAPSEAHDVQLVDSPRQVWHVALQLSQVPAGLRLVISRNISLAQTVLHVPQHGSNVAPARQVVQSADDPAEQVAQDASQGLQAFATSSGKVPSGHAATQPPLREYLVPVLGQLRQDAVDPPEHVRHEGSHAMHLTCAPIFSEYVSDGQALTQVSP